MFPRLFQIGNFYLPTYGVLVATGVLLGLWISVRNSEKQGINGDDAWNLGIFMVLAGIVGAKILYIINDWKDYSGGNWREIFSLNTLQAGGVFSAANGGCIRTRVGFWARAWALRMLFSGMLLRQAYESFLGRDVYKPTGKAGERYSTWREA